MSFRVIKPGMLSTFQDLGRTDFQHLGIPVAGAMDQSAHKLANLLVGNPISMATLEMTLLGATLVAEEACCIAITGADMHPTINAFPVARHRPLVMRPGDSLAFGACQSGARTYLAVHGGFALTSMFGSASTYLRSAIGGFHGRSLQRGDVIDLCRPICTDDLEGLAQELWDVRIYLKSTLVSRHRPRVRVIKSQQWQDFTLQSRTAFLDDAFTVTPVSDRMGYRLAGPDLKLSVPRQMISESVVFGTIQVPVGGQAIVLMADRQTTGGYPKLAYVASIDLPVLAQMAPGASFHFELIELAPAQELDALREAAFRDLQGHLRPIQLLLADATTPAGMRRYA